MSLKGFEGGFVNSKVATTKIINDSHNGGLGLNHFGKNTAKINVPFKSNTKAAINPTTDTDDYGMSGSGRNPEYGISTKGGASGDGPTPGFNGAGAGIAELNGAQGN